MLRKLAVVGSVVAVLGVIGCGGDERDEGVTSQAVKGGMPPAGPVRLAGREASFGRAVAASRDVIAVSAMDEVPGRVHVYERRRSTWIRTATLAAPSATRADWFGRSLALGPNRLVVGAPWAEGGGRAYVFEKLYERWQLTAELRASVSGVLSFGRAVALGGDTLLVGAPDRMEADTGGRVFVFERRGQDWAEVGQMMPEEPYGADGFGFAVAISGDLAIVGAPDTSLGAWGTPLWVAGQAHVFVRTPAGWREDAVLRESPVESSGGFAMAVAAAPGVVVVACCCEDGDAYVYELVDGRWTLVATLQPPWTTLYTGFGHQLAVSNGHLFVTAPFADPEGVPFRWERTAQGWVEDGGLDIPEEEEELQAGHAIAAAGELVVVGSAPGSIGSGAAWIFPHGAR